MCYICVHLCGCTCLYVHTWKQEEDIRSLASLPLPYCLETGSLTELGARLVARKAQHSPVSTYLEQWSYRCLCVRIHLTYYVRDEDLKPDPHPCSRRIHTC